MRRVLFLLACLPIHFSLFSQVTFDWVKSVGGAGSQGVRGAVVDDSGNVYSIGSYTLAGDFDPGPGVFNLGNAGSFDVYVQKLDSAGNFLWAKQIGGTGVDQPSAIAVDADGGVYLTGIFRYTCDFDPGTAVHSLYSLDVASFVAKLDAAGNYVWAIQFAGDHSQTLSITVDAAHAVYTTGILQGQVDFDPGPASFLLAPALPAQDAFVAKLDSSGGFVWARQFAERFDLSTSMPTLVTSFSIAVDDQGNVFTTGSFEDTTDFDPGAGVQNLIPIDRDIFVSKLNAAGNFEWVRQMVGDWEAEANSIAVDDSGNVVIAGKYMGHVDFDPGIDTTIFYANNIPTVFVAKLDANGDFRWVKSTAASSFGSERSVPMALGPQGNIFYACDYGDHSDLDPGTAAFYLAASDNDEICISQLDPQGNFVWAKRLESAYMTALSLDVNASAVYLGGAFYDRCDFDPGLSVAQLTAFNTSMDAYVLKWNYDLCMPTYGTDTLSSCDTLALYGEVLTHTGPYTLVIPNAAGCDSIISLHATIHAFDRNVYFYHDSLFNLDASATFQWVNCDSNFLPIPGATQSTFAPLHDGNYALILTDSACTDTTACIPVILNALQPNGSNSAKVYPNPAHDRMKVVFSSDQALISLQWRSMTGQLVKSEAHAAARELEVELSGLAAGMYILEIATANGVQRQRFVRE